MACASSMGQAGMACMVVKAVQSGTALARTMMHREVDGRARGADVACDSSQSGLRSSGSEACPSGSTGVTQYGICLGAPQG